MRLPSRPTWWAGLPRTILLPLAVAFVQLVGSMGASHGQPETRPLDTLAAILLIAGPVSLVFRRWRPPTVLAFAGALAVVYVAVGYPLGPIFLTVLVALVSAVMWGRRRPAYLVVGVVFLLLLVGHLVRYPAQSLGEIAVGVGLWLAWLAAVIAGAEWRRSRRERLDQARAAREEAERRRGSEERLQLARDLHDVLGHHVSLINVQSGVALHLLDRDPEHARSALAAIKQASSDLLREMRSTLGVLRGIDEEPPRQPVAGMARLDDLLGDVRAAGLPVSLEVRGQPRELPASVDLAGYRIVQEALTNTRQHAGPARAIVLLEYVDDGITLQIDDDGVGAGAAASSSGDGEAGGHGLVGMRERVTTLGGQLSVGPQLRGYRVRAYLPTT